jgi:glycosyltransferase involved in cell wall biosynthesis
VVATGGVRQGYSRAMVEAQAMGRPVVCEQGGGAAEAVREGVTGWFAAEGDSAAMAEAIGVALSLSVERRAELARAAQDNVRGRYGLADANRRLLAVYERLSA